MNQGQLRAVLGYLHRVASPNGGPDDAQLLDRWRRDRDTAAFEVLVWRHGSMVWNVCRRILSHEQDVEDAFQATFLTFLRKSRSIGQGRFLGSWLYKVAYRTALATRAVSTRHTKHEKLDADLPADASEDHWDDLQLVLDEEVNRLPEKYRRPFVLCYLEGKTTDEAAEDLGCPRGTIGTRLAWARKWLCSRLTRRGLSLSATSLGALLTQNASASVSAPLVATAVKAASFSAAKSAVVAGVISARAAVLSQQVLNALLVTKVKTAVLTLVAVGMLGIGASLPSGQLFDAGNVPIQTSEDAPGVGRVEEPIPSIPVMPDEAIEDNPLAVNDHRPTVAPLTSGKELPQLMSGTVVRVGNDGTVGLEIRSKNKGDQGTRVDIKLSNKTELVYSDIGPEEAKLTEGLGVDVWLEKESKDIAARMHLRGSQHPKTMPHREGQVVAVAADGKCIALKKSGKAEPVEPIAIRFSDQTRLTFANVARGRATITAGYEGRVWLENDSQDIAKSLTFSGNAEDKQALVKEKKADRTGRIVAVSDDGQVLTVEIFPTKGEKSTRVEIKLTTATRESYHDVPENGARPAVGYQVQVWLIEGSPDNAERVRFYRNDPREYVDARILGVSPDGNRFTVAMASDAKGGESIRREIETTARTRLAYFNVGPEGARLTEGYHVRGWLMEGSDDTADELMVSRLK